MISWLARLRERCCGSCGRCRSLDITVTISITTSILSALLPPSVVHDIIFYGLGIRGRMASQLLRRLIIPPIMYDCTPCTVNVLVISESTKERRWSIVTKPALLKRLRMRVSGFALFRHRVSGADAKGGHSLSAAVQK